MRFFALPANRWGWMRITGSAILMLVVIWMILAAVLRSMGEVSWLLWSSYQTFSIMNGLEMAVLPLLAVIVSGWLEEQDHKAETEQSRQRDAERIQAEHRQETIQRLQDLLQTIFAEPGQDSTDLPVEIGEKISGFVQAALPELDGKSKGALLRLLFEKDLLTGADPMLKLAGSDFGGANLHKAHFSGICLEKVNFVRAKMDETHLRKSRLCGANLSRAFLRHVDLREADLTGCQLTGANLENANLERADLTDASLEDAFLRHANLKNCILNNFALVNPPPDKQNVLGGNGNISRLLDQAILIDTILPDGRKVTNEKGREYLRNKEIALLVDKL